MPMRATTVRFDESLWSLLEREARTQGVSAAQFVRDATILRIASVATQRGTLFPGPWPPVRPML